jgi:adenylate cyclase
MARKKIELNAGRILPKIEDLAIGEGRKIRAAFVYCDLHGFSKIVASKSTETSLRLLQVFVEFMGRITSFYDGALVDCAGDRTLSVFYTAENDLSPEPVQRAVTAALWMQTIIQRVIAPQFRPVGLLPDVSAAIGIDYGSVVAACVGYRNNKRFVFLGDAANRAAKLQEDGQGNEIVMSDVAFILRPNFLNGSTWHPVNDGNRVRLQQRFADNVETPPKT